MSYKGIEIAKGVMHMFNPLREILIHAVVQKYLQFFQFYSNEIKAIRLFYRKINDGRNVIGL